MNLNESCHYKTNLPHIASEIARKLYYYVQWTGHFICKDDFYIKRANLKSYLLLYTKNGHGILNYDNRKYEIKENSIMLIDCTKTHEYFPDGKKWEFKFIHFMGEASKKYYEYIKELYETVVICDMGEFEKYFDRIYNHVKSAEAEELCSEIIYKILIGIINKYNKSSDSFNIKDILYYISENYENNITVSELADISHLSRCYFSTVFKKSTGFSPYEYILNYRIYSAKRMLRDTLASIEEIASKCGFSDTSSFIRAFKRQEGISPFCYRKEKR